MIISIDHKAPKVMLNTSSILAFISSQSERISSSVMRVLPIRLNGRFASFRGRRRESSTGRTLAIFAQGAQS